MLAAYDEDRRPKAGTRRRFDKPRTLAGYRLYAIGDIHGCDRLLDKLLRNIMKDISLYPCKKIKIVFLGDYVDRGAGSSAVLDLLISFMSANDSVFLRGNHESMLMHFLEKPVSVSDWVQNGGLPTLLSYGVEPPRHLRAHDGARIAAELIQTMPMCHREFLNKTRLTFTCGDYFFVHAGVRPQVVLEKQLEADLLWIRGDFLKYSGTHEKIIVHGHSPVLYPEVHANRINIDTGAYATGILSCLVLEGESQRFI